MFNKFSVYFVKREEGIAVREIKWHISQPARRSIMCLSWKKHPFYPSGTMLQTFATNDKSSLI